MTRPYVPRSLRRRVAAAAGSRCGYCQLDEAVVGIPLEVEHIIPLAGGGRTEEANLWLSCGPCNRIKRDRATARDPLSGVSVPLFHPRRQQWRDHFRWSEDGTLVLGLTATGRATVEALALNREILVGARRRWVAVGLHPPRD